MKPGSAIPMLCLGVKDLQMYRNHFTDVFSLVTVTVPIKKSPEIPTRLIHRGLKDAGNIVEKEIVRHATR